jgi:tetratricopeptide (TPR) repeat protein
MSEPDGAKCPRCGVPLAAGGSADLCPRCTLSDTRGGWSEDRSDCPSSPGGAHHDLSPGSLIAANGATGQQPADARAHYNRGITLAVQGKLEEAIAEFRAEIRINPDDAAAHNELGLALTDQGKLEEAIAELRAAIRIDPDFANPHTNLGAALHEQGEVDEAMAEFRAAIRIDPDLVIGHSNLGVALKMQGKLEEAIAEFRSAIRIDPHDADTHNELKIALEEWGKRNEAIDEDRPAMKSRSPASAIAAIGATLLRCLGFGKRREQQPADADADAHYNRGITQAEQGKREAAAAEFRSAIRLKPELVGAHIGLANALAEMASQMAEPGPLASAAIAEFREAIRLQPDDANAHYGLADALGRQGQREEAIAEYHVAIRLRPQHPRFDRGLGEMLTGQGAWNEVNADAAAHFYLGAALTHRAANTAMVIAEFREAIRLQPDFADAHFRLGYALRAHGEAEEAIAEFRTAIRLRPDDYSARGQLGFTLHRRGMVDEAIAEFREAIRLRPDDPAAYSGLFAALRTKGDFKGALSEMRKVRDLRKAVAGQVQRVYAALDTFGFTQAIERGIAELEQLAELDEKLSFVLSGQAKPASAAETLAFARLCSEKKLHGASAEFWAQAFQADRTLADDADAHHRYHAACAAALAASGQGKAGRPLDLAAQARLRRQALDWLRAELAAWNASVGGNNPPAPADLARALMAWKAEGDLAGGRDPDALARLPEAERKDWRALWADIEALLMRASRAAIQLNPHDAEPHFYLGHALRDQGNLNEAIAAFRAAIRLQPDAAEARTCLGIALADQAKLEEAITEFRAAIRIDPHDAGAHCNLGLALRAKGELDEAIAAFRAARDRAQPGSELARQIERALAESYQ